MLLLSLLLALLAPAGAQGTPTKVWVDDRDPKVVWASFSDKDAVALFDARVPAEPGFAPPPGWLVTRFSLTTLSPEGKRVAFKASAQSTSGVGVFGLETRRARILDTDCDAQSAAWSPDGRFLAVVDSRGLLNNAVRLMGSGHDTTQVEISGDVLADLGFTGYGFRSARQAGLDVWRTQVYDARWLSDRLLSFQLKRVHLKAPSGAVKPKASEEAPEGWTFDVEKKAFARR